MDARLCEALVAPKAQQVELAGEEAFHAVRLALLPTCTACRLLLPLTRRRRITQACRSAQKPP
jgi:hypothetical protein